MSWNLSPRQLRAGIAGAAVALVCATAWWATRPTLAQPPAKGVAAGMSWQSAPSGVKDSNPGVARQTRSAPGADVAALAVAGTVDSEVATVAQYTSGKYRLLLEDLRGLRAEDVGQLRHDLLTRELLAGAIKSAREADDPAKADEVQRQEAALSKVEGAIRGRLHPSDHATYEALKDADNELFQLDDYAGGIRNVAPLSDADRDSILRTKLAYKTRFRQLVKDAGLMRANLSAAEREYAYAVTSRALEDYKRSYLQEVRQFLADDEQYALLSNYENTEFTAELAKLRSMANGGEHKEVVVAVTR
jgi:hypothetical protein